MDRQNCPAVESSHVSVARIRRSLSLCAVDMANQPSSYFFCLDSRRGHSELVLCRARRLDIFLAMVFHSMLGLQERSEEHTSELQSQSNLVCRLLLEKKNIS